MPLTLSTTQPPSRDRLTLTGPSEDEGERDSSVQSPGVRSSVAERVTDELAGDNPLLGGIMDPDALARIANRCREKIRPKDPKNLDFELVDDFLLDEFLCGDITVKEERHLLFATERQLSQLSHAQHWFLDGTFKIVKDPFYQLMSVHAFLKVGKQMKMVPLFFAVMSRRRKLDYIKVFRQLLECLPSPPEVKVITMDFESATWLALGMVLPGVKLRGCVFHFTQAIWRKCQEIGLQKPYRTNQGVHRFIKKIMALAYLPHSHIRPAFWALQLKTSTPGLKSLCQYFDRQLMSGSLFPISSWSVFNQSIRTNNHVEGWNRRLNSRNGEQTLGLYKLIPALHKEARQVDLHARLLHDGKLKQYTRTKACRTQEEVFAAWQLYKTGGICPSELLNLCSRVTGPAE